MDTHIERADRSKHEPLEPKDPINKILQRFDLSLSTEQGKQLIEDFFGPPAHIIPTPASPSKPDSTDVSITAVPLTLSRAVQDPTSIPKAAETNTKPQLNLQAVSYAEPDNVNDDQAQPQAQQLTYPPTCSDLAEVDELGTVGTPSSVESERDGMTAEEIRHLLKSNQRALSFSSEW